MAERRWSDKARALLFGSRMDAIRFRQGQWWAVDYTGALAEPITRKMAYSIAVSYMNAREIADYNAHEEKSELKREERRYRASTRTKQAARNET